ncbi:MAG: hypothetical protein MR654_08675, partial [Corynebacterium glucuronolyticum]|nr:hypothetical protein [Corynebacterium glucuronolyticum]
HPSRLRRKHNRLISMPSKNNINTTTQTTNAPPSTAPAELTNYIGTPPKRTQLPEELSAEVSVFFATSTAHVIGNELATTSSARGMFSGATNSPHNNS